MYTLLERLRNRIALRTLYLKRFIKINTFWSKLCIEF